MEDSYIVILAGIFMAAAFYASVCRFVKNGNDRTIEELKELDETLKNDAKDGEHFRAIDHFNKAEYHYRDVDPDISCVVGDKEKVN